MVNKMNFEQAMAAIDKIEEDLAQVKGGEKLNALFSKTNVLLTINDFGNATPIIRESVLNAFLIKMMNADVLADNVSASSFYARIKEIHPNIPALIKLDLDKKFNMGPNVNMISDFRASHDPDSDGDYELEDFKKLPFLLKSLTRDFNPSHNIEKYLGVTIMNRNGDFLYMNKRAQELFGLYNTKSTPDINFFSIQPTESRKRIFKKYGPRIFSDDSESPTSTKIISFVAYSHKKINPPNGNKKVNRICKKKDFLKDKKLFGLRFQELMRTACVSLVGKMVRQPFGISQQIMETMKDNKNILFKNLLKSTDIDPFKDDHAKVETEPQTAVSKAETKNFDGESASGSAKANGFPDPFERIAQTDLILMVVRKSTRASCPSFILNANPDEHEKEYMSFMQN